MKPRAPESQRDSALQPKVARHALPWVSRRDCHQPQRSCARPRNGICRNPVGVETQGSAALNPGLNDVAPLGQTRWLEQRRIVGELDALQAEVDALKRLEAESRRGLHPPLIQCLVGAASENRRLTFYLLTDRDGEEGRHPSVFPRLPPPSVFGGTGRRDRRPRLQKGIVKA